MIDVVLFGGVGAASIAAMVLKRIEAAGGNLRPVGFLNDVEPEGTMISDLPVLGRFADWKKLGVKTCFLAPLHKYGAMKERFDIVKRLEIPYERLSPACIDPSAAVASDTMIDRGSIISAGAHVLPGASVGNHVFLRNGSCVSHDVQIGNFVSIGVNSVVNGYTRIDDGVYVGPQAVIRDGISIGTFANVKMGAVVAKALEPELVC